MNARIRVIAPSHGLTCEKRHDIRAYLRNIGIEPIYPNRKRMSERKTFSPYDGSEFSVFSDLIQALSQNDTPLIWAARGGSGSHRLFPLIQRYRDLIIRMPPKIIVGYSDVTFLLNSLAHFPQLTCVHASTLSELSRYDVNGITDMPYRIRQTLRYGDARHLWRCDHAIVGAPLNQPAEDVPFPAEAPKEGGNLTLIQRSLGTPWQIPSISGSVLVIEDLHSGVDNLRCMIEHIYQATSGLQGCRAIVCGDINSAFNDQGEKVIHGDEQESIDIVRYLAQRCRLPLWKGFVGHGRQNIPFRVGSYQQS